MTDTLLDTINAFQAAKEKFNAIDPDTEAEANQAAAATFVPWLNKIRAWTSPAETCSGAVAALRIASEENTDFQSEPAVGAMLNSALGFFEIADQTNGEALANACDLAARLDLSDVTGHAWHAVYDGLTEGMQHFYALMNRPQCETNKNLNAGGRYLEAMAEFLAAERERVMSIITARAPYINGDPETLNKVILEFEAERFDGDYTALMSKIAVMQVQQRAYAEGRKS